MADESTLTTRLLRAVTGVLEKYAAEARDEAWREVRRLVVGFIALVFMGVFMLHAAAFGHAAAVAIAVHFGAPLPYVLGAVVVFDASMALFALFVAWMMLWRPILPRTRKNIAEVGKVYRLIAG